MVKCLFLAVDRLTLLCQSLYEVQVGRRDGPFLCVIHSVQLWVAIELEIDLGAMPETSVATCRCRVGRVDERGMALVGKASTDIGFDTWLPTVRFDKKLSLGSFISNWCFLELNPNVGIRGRLVGLFHALKSSKSLTRPAFLCFSHTDWHFGLVHSFLCAISDLLLNLHLNLILNLIVIQQLTHHRQNG